MQLGSVGIALDDSLGIVGPEVIQHFAQPFAACSDILLVARL